jgi:hypothetical protein
MDRLNVIIIVLAKENFLSKSGGHRTSTFQLAVSHIIDFSPSKNDNLFRQAICALRRAKFLRSYQTEPEIILI